MPGIRIYVKKEGLYARLISYPEGENPDTARILQMELERLGIEGIETAEVSRELDNGSDGTILLAADIPKDLHGTCWVDLDNKGGAKLTASSPRGEGDPVTEPDVLKELELAGVDDYEIIPEDLPKTLEDCTTSEIPVTFQIAKKKGAFLSVEVDPKKMYAAITYISGEDIGDMTLADALDKLKQHGVVYGINEKRLIEIIGSSNSVDKEIIAEGLASVDGENARIEYGFDAFFENVGPKIKEHDKADYKDLGKFENVVAGAVLATKIEGKRGTDGKNVCGEIVPALSFQDVQLRGGKNTELKDNGNSLVSLIDGQPKLVQGKVMVEEVLIVRGDVDFSTGNIDFIGSVIINGCILTGFAVKAAGDIHCMDVVEGGIIEADGDIVLKWGVKGQGKGRIKAGGNIKARFIESCYVQAAGSIEVEDVIIHSEVRAGKGVTCTSGYGWIDGGEVIAGETIQCNVLGSQVGVATSVEVGINPQLKEEYEGLEGQIEQLKTRLDVSKDVVTRLNTLRKRGKLKADMINKYKAAATEYDVLKKLCDGMVERFKEVEELLKPSFDGCITAAHISHPFVTVTIGNVKRECKDSFRSVKFHYHKGKIEIADLNA